MKKLLIITALFATSFSFAQNLEFSKKTKKLYDKLLKAEMKNGLTENEAIPKVLENSDYKQLYNKDLASANKKATKAGIMYSKRFGYIVLHKNVAIIPFVTSFTDNVTKQQSKKENLKHEAELSDKAQEELFKYLIKNQFKYSVEFQDINRTNQLLKASGVLNTLSSTTDEELAEILGVDGVIRGEFVQEIDKGRKPLSLGLSNKMATGTIELTIGDGASGETLWRIQTESSKGGKGIDNVIANIMDRISKYFPYSTGFSRK